MFLFWEAAKDAGERGQTLWLDRAAQTEYQARSQLADGMRQCRCATCVDGAPVSFIRYKLECLLFMIIALSDQAPQKGVAGICAAKSEPAD